MYTCNNVLKEIHYCSIMNLLKEKENIDEGNLGDRNLSK